jgi:preprotein translocase subunit SecA
VLVGTTSVEKSDHLSGLLTHRYGIVHEVLNARPENAAREADIVALAGQQRPLKRGSKEMVGNVTIATNMAGRGTDIKLGPGVVWHHCKVPALEKFAELGVAYQPLFPTGVTKCCIHCPEYNPATDCAHCFKPRLDADFPSRGRKECPGEVPCGLHIVGTERHEARRIDNQLRGRSGRQGDPGSGRFFLSLRDDLMAIFAGEWTLKVLGWLGLQQGQAIEDKRISKGIERAQKKVEQRNFDIRKNLLDYDEVMDHQRRYFYTLRQEIMEGRDIEAKTRQLITEVIDEALAKYLDENYPRRCIADWARQNLEAPIPFERIHGETPQDLPMVEGELKEAAKEEAAATITITIGEYADPDSDQTDWDLRGLSSWAMSRFNVSVSQNQLRRLSTDEMAAMLTTAAQEQIDGVDCSGLARFLDPLFRSCSLAEWARAKFGVDIPLSELPAGDPEQASANLHAAVDHAYLRREIEYPPEYAMDMTVGQVGVDNVYARKALCDWANRKYQVSWQSEATVDRSIQELRDELVGLSEQSLVGGELERRVEQFLAGLPGGGRSDGKLDAAVLEFAHVRFDTQVDEDSLARQDLREALVRMGRAFLRRELTELERFVLLQIHDSTWVSHLLAMDHLKSSVGLRGYAEQDPKIAYKKEGFRLFQEMLSSVREKVTDIVFKVRLSAGAQVQSAYQVSHMVHEQLSGYDQLAQDMAAQQAAAAPQKIEQIVRQAPKVGRNDPCPCGSGKKYKKCCGKPQ